MRVHNTKFVCTLGPASESPNVLKKMIQNGMDIARLNFSHGSHKNHLQLIKNIRATAQQLMRPVGILQDLQGPKIRIGAISDKGVEVKKGKTIILDCGPKKQSRAITVQYKNLYKDVKKGNILLVDDGLIELKVEKIVKKEIHCKVLNSGIIKKNKGINVPEAEITINPITAKDKKDLAFGVKHNVDFVALSFVKEAKDIHNLRKLIPKNKQHIKIIAKIERKEAIKNLEEIIDAADGIMVARGDLAMEVGPEKVPLYQKRMIYLANLAGKPVITATHMLQSMIHNPQPTRAEVSDTANAIFDHSDAIMLSNETAVGDYPIRAVQMFAKVAKSVEQELKNHHELLPARNISSNKSDILGLNACELAEESNAQKIIVITDNMHSVAMISKHRTYVPTVVITESKTLLNQLTLMWGINFALEGRINESSLIQDVKKITNKNKHFKKGESVIIFFNKGSQKHIVSTTL